jgi:hypothetical protein
MDMAAEKLRETGARDFEKMWEPPAGMDRRAGVKQLLKFLVLKDCWSVFTTDIGKEWFKKYCEEYVKVVEEDYMKDDKRERIRKMLERPPPQPKVEILVEKKVEKKVGGEVNGTTTAMGEIQGKTGTATGTGTTTGTTGTGGTSSS